MLLMLYKKHNHFHCCVLVLSEPLQVSAHTVNCYRIQVSWNAVSSNGTQLDTYRVFYRMNSSDSEETKIVRDTEVLLSGLKPSTLYYISIAPVSRGVVGTRSSEVQNATYGG